MLSAAHGSTKTRSASHSFISIKRYFEEHLEQDVGDLKAGTLLDFCLKEIGPLIYNRAVADSQSYFQGRVADLEGVCYEPEFTYWAPAPADRGGIEQKKGRV